MSKYVVKIEQNIIQRRIVEAKSKEEAEQIVVESQKARLEPYLQENDVCIEEVTVERVADKEDKEAFMAI